MSDPTPRDPRGQILVIVALAMIAIVGMVGLVIDGGYAWGKQRETQNGADSVSKAGAQVIQSSLIGTPRTTGDVGCAVEDMADANEVDLESAEYTNHLGAPYAPSVAVPVCGAGGAIPTGAQGVRAVTRQQFRPFLAQVVGIGQFTTTADATAVVGIIPSICPASAGCGVLPVTFPMSGTVCDSLATPFTVTEDDGDGTWEPYEILPEGAALTTANMAVVPLCDTAPGSVGWIDYGCGNLATQITTPCNGEIPIPAWLHTQTGNPNCCEDELNDFAGPNVMLAEDADSVLAIPIHDNTCWGRPADNDPTCAPIDTEWSGNGNNLNYHIPFWVGFKLNQAYVQGGDTECKSGPGSPYLVSPIPAGKVGCLKGWFVARYGAPGPVTTGVVNPAAPVPTGILLVE